MATVGDNAMCKGHHGIVPNGCHRNLVLANDLTCTILMMIFVIFVVISCHSEVEATRTLKEDFASDNHHHKYLKI
ncbi:hypothetical protein CFP56_033019 [Quercus suber]|uniref:Transmembrane protein n=1 Tax=Quercus suber TaxID=58331 RepID=A0AAW0JFA1_QUESU